MQLQKKNSSTSSTPPSSSWQSFSTFENIATGVLFAEDATIGGWQFNNNYIRSANNCIGLSGYESDKIPFLSAGDSNNPGFVDGKPSNTGLIRMYSTGTIIVGHESNDSTKAGISGRSDKLVNGGYQRFWAGSGRNIDGPFYVLDNGFLKASNAYITGELICNKMTCTSVPNWKAPGLIAIIHIGGNSNSLNYIDIATVGGYSVTKASTFSPSKGVFAFNHNIGNTNYTITWIGNKKYSSEGVSGTDVYGFQGSAAFTKSSTSFTVKFADRDGDTSFVPHTSDGRRSVDLCIFTQTL